MSPDAIKHRLSSGRLHPIARGVYAVGRPELTRHAKWMAAALVCGDGVALSHVTAAALWGIAAIPRGPIEISVPAPAAPRRRGIVVHRRSPTAAIEITTHRRIPVTSPLHTLIDYSTRASRKEVEAAINEGDNLGLFTVAGILNALDEIPARPGVGVLRRMLDPHAFRRTRSWLERQFLRLVRQAGLPAPLTQQWVNGFEVDFYWPELGLVVEVDGGRHHRTPIQQTNDRLREHAHLAAGLTPLRFTWGQIRYRPAYVQATLAGVARQLLTAD